MTYRRSIITLFLIGVGLLSIAALCIAEESTFPITGKVTFSNGSPAAGTLVEIVWPKNGGRAIADASGIYKLVLKPGYFGLRATLGDFVLNNDLYMTLNDAGKVDRSLDIKLTPGAIVVGTLVDKSTGKPVSGAKIMLRDWTETVTDDNGIFRFVGIPQTRHTITALKDGYYRPIVNFSALNKTYVEVPLETKPEGVIKGIVTDDLGKPVAGASVGVSGCYFDFQRVKTDENGKYVLPGYDPDERALLSISEDNYDWINDQPVIFPTNQREVTANFQLRSKKGDIRTIVGRVTRVDGTPIASAKVAYGWSDCAVGYTTTKTDDEGKFIFKGVDNAKNIVVAEAAGFAPAFKYVKEKVDAQIELVMEPGHWIEAQFVNEDKKPLEGVHVSLDVETPEMIILGFCGNEPYRWVSPRATSDKDGRFRLENLPAGRILIETNLNGYSRIDRMPLQVDRKDHVITVTRPGQVSGTVVNAADGKPIKAFQIGRSYDERGTNFNGQDGKFTISNSFMSPGDCVDLFVQAPGYLGAYINSAKVQSAANVNYNAIKIKLQPSRSFSGIVTEARSGKPLEGVLVTLLDTSNRGLGWFQWKSIPEVWHAMSVRTNAKGAFRVENVPAKCGSIMLEKSGYAKTLLPEVELFKPLKASITLGSTVKGTVVDEAGSPSKGVYVSVGDVDGKVQYDNAKTDAEGKFCFTDLPKGDLRVQQHGDSRVTKLHDFNVAAGQDYTVDWDRSEPSQVEGKITLDGAPVDGAHVIINLIKGGAYAGFDDTEKDGTYSFKVHKPGQYSITCSRMDPNRIWVRDTINIKPGKNRFDFAFPSASISGTLIDSKTRQPIPNASLCAYNLQTEKERVAVTDYSWQHTNPIWWPKNQVKTDAEGKFEIKNIEKGEWAITVSSDSDSNLATPCAPFHVGKDEKKTGLTVEIPQVGSAEVKAIDAKTGKIVDASMVVCVNEWGFASYPTLDKSQARSVGCSGSACRIYLKGSGGGILFPSLPYGRYTVFVQTQTHMPARAVIDVKPGKVTKTTVRLVKGQKIVFRLMESPENPIPGLPWVGFKIKSPGKSKPVLNDYQGPYWGKVLFLTGDSPRKAELQIEPGTYDLEMVLRREHSSGILGSKDNLWSGKMKVKVIKGKYTVIDIPCKK